METMSHWGMFNVLDDEQPLPYFVLHENGDFDYENATSDLHITGRHTADLHTLYANNSDQLLITVHQSQEAPQVLAITGGSIEIPDFYRFIKLLAEVN